MLERISLFFVLSVLILCPGSGIAQNGEAKESKKDEKNKEAEGVSLRYRFAVGDVLRYQVRSEWQSIPDGGDEAQKSGDRFERTTVEEWTVLSVGEDGFRKIRIDVRSVSVQLESGGEKSGFDTQDLEDEAKKKKLAARPEFAAAVALQGSSLTLQLSPAGDVLAVEGGDALRQALSKAMEASGKAGEKTREEAAKILSDEALQARFQRTFALGPGTGKSVRSGEEWARAYRLDLGQLGRLAEAATVRVDSLDDKVASLEIRSQFEYAKPEKTSLEGLEFEVAVRGTGDGEDARVIGTATFDLEKGCLTRAQTKLRYTVTTHLLVDGFRQTGVRTGSQSTVVELLSFTRGKKGPTE